MNPSNKPQAGAATAPSRWKRALNIAMPVVILAVCVLVAIKVFTSKPVAHRAKPVAHAARLVTITPAEIARPTLLLSANGVVEAADSTDLRARVSGQVIALTEKLAPGTRFDKGDVLARIDPADYRLALSKTKVQLGGAQAALRVEQGQQAVAEGELALIDQDISPAERDLALRGPQLEQARGDVAAARSEVEQAQLNLARTEVRAPFAGIVTAREASVGDVIATSDTLATIAATDAYWVNVSLPVDQLRWLHAENGVRGGSPAQIFYPDAWGDDRFLPATVLRIEAGLETDGRQARVILRVPNPLGDGTANAPRLLLGAYVQARLQADIPDGSVVIDSAFLHENDQVWVLTRDNKLNIRSVDVVYRDDSQAVIADGLQAGESVVTSELTAPIPGMPLRVETDTHAPPPPVNDETVPADDVSGHAPPALRLRLSDLPPAGKLMRAANDDKPRS